MSNKHEPRGRTLRLTIGEQTRWRSLRPDGSLEVRYLNARKSLVISSYELSQLEDRLMTGCLFSEELK